MTGGLDPTETIDNSVSVLVFDDKGRDDRVRCSSYEEAISVAKSEIRPSVFVQIEAADGDVVFSSETMEIESWETEWRRAKRRRSVDVERHDCPHGSVGCFADDLCVECQIDRVQAGYLT
jgi:hypothetical protein